MKRTFSAVLIILVMMMGSGCVLYYNGVDTARDVGISTEYIVEKLSQSEWRGRLTGMAGNIAAGEFLEDVFYRIGLVPPAWGSFRVGYLQTVYDPDISNPRLRVYFEDGNLRELIYGTEFGVNVYFGGADLTLPITRDRRYRDMAERFFVGPDFNRQPQALRPVESIGIVHGYGLAAITGFNIHDFLNIALLRTVYLEIQWERVEYISFTMYNSGEERIVCNIAGLLPGLDSTRAVVVGAHFDGVGYMGEIYTQGALDNASGIAAMLRAAQIIAAWDTPPETDIIFVAFNGEENGLFGSLAFAEQLLGLDLYDEIYMINIDCVGFAAFAPFALDLSGFGVFLADLEANIALNFAAAAIMDEWGLEFIDSTASTDHMSFQMHGIPAVTVSQLSPEVMAIIHTAYDRVDILDFDGIDIAGDLVVELIYRIGADFSFETDGIDEIRGGAARTAFGDIDHGALFGEITRLRRELELAFDEIYTFEMDGNIVTFAGGEAGGITYEEFRAFFPYIYIRREIRGFALEGIDVSTRERPIGMMIGQGGFAPPDTLGRRRVNLDDINTISLRYVEIGDPANSVHIAVQQTAHFHQGILGDMGYDPIDAEITGSPYFWTREIAAPFPFDNLFDVAFFDGELFVMINQVRDMENALEWIAYLDIENDREYYWGLLER